MLKTPDHSSKSSSSTSMDSKLLQTLNPTDNAGHNNNIESDNPSSVLDQILLHKGRNTTSDSETDRASLPVAANQTDVCDTDMVSSVELIQPLSFSQHEWFVHLPGLECPTALPSIFHTPSLDHWLQPMDELTYHHQDQSTRPVMAGDWAAFDQLVASQLNGQAETPSSLAFGLQLADEEEEEEEDDHKEPTNLTPRLGTNRSDNQTLQAYNTNEGADFWSFIKSSSLPPSDPLHHLSV